jgi:hypothetical protein
VTSAHTHSRRPVWPLVVAAVVLTLVWLGWAFLFMAMAWGLRGEAKPIWMGAGALAAWFGWVFPLGAVVAAIVRIARSD